MSAIAAPPAVRGRDDQIVIEVGGEDVPVTCAAGLVTETREERHGSVTDADTHHDHEVRIEIDQGSRRNQAVIQEVISAKDALVQHLRLDDTMAELLDKVIGHLRSNTTEQEDTDELPLCHVFNDRGTLLHVITVAILKPSEHEHLYMALFDCVLWVAANPRSVVLKNDSDKKNVFDLIVEEMHVPLLRKVLDEHMCISSDNELDVSFLINTPLKQRHYGELIKKYSNWHLKNLRLEQILYQALRKGVIDEILGIGSIRILSLRLCNLVTTLFIFAIVWHIYYSAGFSFACIKILRRADNQSNQTNQTDQTKQTFLVESIVWMGCAECMIFVWLLVIDMIMVMKICSRADNQMARLKWASQKRILFVLPYVCMWLITWRIIDESDVISRYYIISITLLWCWLLTFRLSFAVESMHFFTQVICKIISENVIQILTAYVIFLFGFSVAIHVQFMASADKSIYHTLFLMFNIMVGMGDLFTVEVETSLDAAGISPLFSKIIYIMYLVFVSIILLNLLIAMMNTSYSLMKQEHSRIWKVDATVCGIMAIVFFHRIVRFVKMRTSHAGRLIVQMDKKTDTLQTVAGEQRDVNARRQMRNMENRVTNMRQVSTRRVEDLAEQQSEMKGILNEMLSILRQNTSMHSINSEGSEETVKIK